jgi:secreted PhoX family phosphatase
MINRRHFIQTLAAAAAASSGTAIANRDLMFGSLNPDRKRIMDLPAGFEYTVISRAGDEMSDGLVVPGLADGMAAFNDDDGFVRLVCNHEIGPYEKTITAFGRSYEWYDRVPAGKMYDPADDTPAGGGTTTIVYDQSTGTRVKQFMSLAGTEFNCAGGPTPWGSWLSCEETFTDPGPAWESGQAVNRSQRHGYVFEVPSASNGLVDPVPLKAMGRFEHEAAAVDPASGVVYLTEDRHRSLLYRYIPLVPGELHLGGQLQALAVVDRDGFDTRNWGDEPSMKSGDWFATRWVDIPNPDTDTNDLRLRGYSDGAARFARGEGLCIAEGSVFITCTIGGPNRLGQVFEYRVSPREGTDGEREEPGSLRLIAESDRESILRNADNITMSPWGDLIVCEDTADHCGLVGIRPDGTLYALADNAYSDSELAGVCFSPDGSTLFVNIQEPGMTLAINGPWPA